MGTGVEVTLDPTQLEDEDAIKELYEKQMQVCRNWTRDMYEPVAWIKFCFSLAVFFVSLACSFIIWAKYISIVRCWVEKLVFFSPSSL